MGWAMGKVQCGDAPTDPLGFPPIYRVSKAVLEPQARLGPQVLW